MKNSLWVYEISKDKWSVGEHSDLCGLSVVACFPIMGFTFSIQHSIPCLH